MRSTTLYPLCPTASLFALLLNLGSAFAQPQEPEPPRESGDWQFSDLNSNEAGGVCAASQHSGELINVLALAVNADRWIWYSRPLRSSALTAGRTYRLTFDFNGDSTLQLQASAISDSTLKLEPLPPRLLKGLADAERLSLSLDGQELDTLDYLPGRDLIAQLLLCQQQHNAATSAPEDAVANASTSSKPR